VVHAAAIAPSPSVGSSDHVAEMKPAAHIAFAIDFNLKLKAPVTATGSARIRPSRTSNHGRGIGRLANR
jgi:hypothetical protein